jgi:hypothetical protein
MPGYLDQYGAGDERRIKIIKRIVFSGVAVLIAGSVLFFIFHNYRQEQRAKQFVASLAARDYERAYSYWVRTEQDRQGYPMASFLRDWGPSSEHADVGGFRIVRSRSCGSGVILTVRFDKGSEEKLWVERDELTIGFSPLQGCPAPR